MCQKSDLYVYVYVYVVCSMSTYSVKYLSKVVTVGLRAGWRYFWSTETNQKNLNEINEFLFVFQVRSTQSCFLYSFYLFALFNRFAWFTIFVYFIQLSHFISSRYYIHVLIIIIIIIIFTINLMVVLFRVFNWKLFVQFLFLRLFCSCVVQALSYFFLFI